MSEEKVKENSDKMNKPNQEPLDHEKKNEPNQEPLDHEKKNEPNQEPLDHEKMNEPNQEPLDHEKINGSSQEPLNNEKINELNKETMDNDKIHESDQELSDHNKKNEPNQEPLDQEKKNELNKEQLDHDKKNEPVPESSDNDKSADELGSSPNFVKKMKNVARNVAKYLQSNGSRVYIWGIGEIDPENNADANTGAGQHATNGPNAKDETDLLTTIHITKKQQDKRLQCTVCLDEYVLGEEAMKLICGHIFHERCITHWIILHGTCPVCRRYYCPGELHLPRERVGVFRSIVRRVGRTIRSPLFYFFPSLAYAQAMYDRRGTTPMYRLIRAERVTSPLEPAQSASTEMIDDYIFYHVMFVLQNVNNEQNTGSPDAIAANMRRRFNRLHRETNANPAARGNPPRQRQGFQAGDNPPPQRQGFQAGDNPPPQRQGFQAGDNPPPQPPGFQAGDNPPPQPPGFQAGDNPPPQRPGFQAGENPPPQRPEFHFPAGVFMTEYLGHY